MATQTYAQLREQIAALERQAVKAKDEETAGVVARIRVAIDAYGITPQDLFGRKSGVVKGAYKGKASAPAKFIDGKGGQWVGRGKRPKWLSDALAAGKHLEDFLAEKFDSAVEAFSAPATVGVPLGEKSVSKRNANKAGTKVKTTKPARAGKKAGSSAKYSDGAGNSWSGMGPTPRWLRDAVAGGKAHEDFLVKN